MIKKVEKILPTVMVIGLAATLIASGVSIFLLIEEGKATFLTVLDTLAVPLFFSIIVGFSFINRTQNKDLVTQINKNSELRENLWAEKALSEGLEAKDKAMQGLISALTSYIVQHTPDEQETIEIINPATGEKATITIKTVENK